MHVYVSASKTAKYPCPVCGKMCDRYDNEETERVWRHGDVVFFPCYVYCRRPRVKCNDGIHVVTAPWARENSRYTLLFESYAMLLVEAMLVNQARKLLRISHTSFVSDMLSAYMSARSICFPNATKVIDKFHVKQRRHSIIL